MTDKLTLTEKMLIKLTVTPKMLLNYSLCLSRHNKLTLIREVHGYVAPALTFNIATLVISILQQPSMKSLQASNFFSRVKLWQQDVRQMPMNKNTDKTEI